MNSMPSIARVLRATITANCYVSRHVYNSMYIYIHVHVCLRLQGQIFTNIFMLLKRVHIRVHISCTTYIYTYTIEMLSLN